jgi:ribose 5-phosphate isomerase A
VGADKLVPVLGSRGILPVEVVPFGLPLCRRRLRELGCTTEVRTLNGRAYVSDNGNQILDCAVSPIANPGEFEQAILSIPGVVGTGLFIGMANTVLVQDGDRIQTRRRSDR